MPLYLDDCRSTSGTAGYMPPELYCPPYRHGRAADWFAFGVTLYELVTGKLPFQEAEIKAMVMDVSKCTTFSPLYGSGPEHRPLQSATPSPSPPQVPVLEVPLSPEILAGKSKEIELDRSIRPLPGDYSNPAEQQTSSTGVRPPPFEVRPPRRYMAAALAELKKCGRSQALQDIASDLLSARSELRLDSLHRIQSHAFLSDYRWSELARPVGRDCTSDEQPLSPSQYLHPSQEEQPSDALKNKRISDHQMKQAQEVLATRPLSPSEQRLFELFGFRNDYYRTEMEDIDDMSKNREHDGSSQLKTETNASIVAGIAHPIKTLPSTEPGSLLPVELADAAETIRSHSADPESVYSMRRIAVSSDRAWSEDGIGGTEKTAVSEEKIGETEFSAQSQGGQKAPLQPDGVPDDVDSTRPTSIAREAVSVAEVEAQVAAEGCYVVGETGLRADRHIETAALNEKHDDFIARHPFLHRGLRFKVIDK